MVVIYVLCVINLNMSIGYISCLLSARKKKKKEKKGKTHSFIIKIHLIVILFHGSFLTYSLKVSYFKGML